MQLLSSTTASGTVYTSPFQPRSAFNSAQLFWGAVTGTWTVWVSDKGAPVLTDDTDWTQVSLDDGITQPSGSASNDFVNLNELAAKWIRFKYVHGSGTGAIEVWVREL
jgi:hypothetical protein